MPLQLPLMAHHRAATRFLTGTRQTAVAVAIAALIGAGPFAMRAAAQADNLFFLAPGQSVFVGALTATASGLEARLTQTGLPGLPDTLWTVGGIRDWQIGNPASPFRLGIQGVLAVGEEAVTGKRVRVTQAYLGPRGAYRTSPLARLSTEMALGVGLAVTAVTLVHADPPTLQAWLAQAYESTIWRAGLVVTPEVIVGAIVMDGLSIELGMGYQYDVGIGGWRNSTGTLLSDAPRDGLAGLRYRLAVTWGQASTPEALQQGSQAEPWAAIAGLTVVSLDSPTASRLRLPDLRGAHVIHVTRSSPAARAGLLEDDVIRRIGSVDVLSAQHFMQELASYRPGDVVPLRVWRVESPAPFVRRGILVDVLLQLPAQ